MIKMFSAVAALALAIPGVASAQVWTDWDAAAGRRLIEAEGGVVDKVTMVDGKLEIEATMDDWLIMVLIGEDCTPVPAQTTRCERLAYNAIFTPDDASIAPRLEREAAYQYVVDASDGGDYIIHRQVELKGGANFANLRAQLSSFIAVSELISDRIWPPKTEAAGKTAR